MTTISFDDLSNTPSFRHPARKRRGYASAITCTLLKTTTPTLQHCIFENDNNIGLEEVAWRKQHERSYELGILYYKSVALGTRPSVLGGPREEFLGGSNLVVERWMESRLLLG